MLKISTKNLIYLTLFFSPVYLVRFSIFKIPLNLLDLLILLTLAYWLYEHRNNLGEIISSSLKKINPIFFPIALILFGLFSSALLNNNLLKELGIIKSWFLLPLVFGFIILTEIKKITDLTAILKTIFLSSFLISILSLFYPIFNELTYDGRLRGFYLSPNHLAMILIPGSLIGLWDILKSKKINFFKLIYLLPILVTIFFTHSYGAWLTLIFSTLLLLFFNHKRLILFFLILIFTLILAEYPSEKFQHLSNFQIKSSATSRIVIWQSAKKIIADHWFWGIGAGNFQEKYLAYQPYFKPYPEWAVPQPHNLFLAFWLQTGLLGLGGFLYLLISWGTKIIKILIFSKDFYQKRFSLLIFVLFFSHLIYGLIDTPYWKNDLSLIFWIIIYLGLQLEFLSRPLDNNSK